MNNNLSRFADSKVYFQCPICTKSMDIQGNSLIVDMDIVLIFQDMGM